MPIKLFDVSDNPEVCLPVDSFPELAQFIVCWAGSKDEESDLEGRHYEKYFPDDYETRAFGTETLFVPSTAAFDYLRFDFRNALNGTVTKDFAWIPAGNVTFQRGATYRESIRYDAQFGANAITLELYQRRLYSIYSTNAELGFTHEWQSKLAVKLSVSIGTSGRYVFASFDDSLPAGRDLSRPSNNVESGIPGRIRGSGFSGRYGGALFVQFRPRDTFSRFSDDGRIAPFDQDPISENYLGLSNALVSQQRMPGSANRQNGLSVNDAPNVAAAIPTVATFSMVRRYAEIDSNYRIADQLITVSGSIALWPGRFQMFRPSILGGHFFVWDRSIFQFGQYSFRIVPTFIGFEFSIGSIQIEIDVFRNGSFIQRLIRSWDRSDKLEIGFGFVGEIPYSVRPQQFAPRPINMLSIAIDSEAVNLSLPNQGFDQGIGTDYDTTGSSISMRVNRQYLPGSIVTLYAPEVFDEQDDKPVFNAFQSFQHPFPIE